MGEDLELAEALGSGSLASLCEAPSSPTLSWAATQKRQGEEVEEMSLVHMGHLEHMEHELCEGEANMEVNLDVEMLGHEALEAETTVWSPGATSRLLLHGGNMTNTVLSKPPPSQPQAPLPPINGQLMALPPIAAQMPLSSSPTPPQQIKQEQVKVKADVKTGLETHIGVTEHTVIEGTNFASPSRILISQLSSLSPMIIGSLPPAVGLDLAAEGDMGLSSPLCALNGVGVIGHLSPPPGSGQVKKTVAKSTEVDAVRAGSRLRGRSVLSEEQLNYLEERLRSGSLDEESELVAIACHLDLPLSRVKNWFFNNQHRQGRGKSHATPPSKLSPEKHEHADRSGPSKKKGGFKKNAKAGAKLARTTAPAVAPAARGRPPKQKSSKPLLPRKTDQASAEVTTTTAIVVLPSPVPCPPPTLSPTQPCPSKPLIQPSPPAQEKQKVPTQEKQKVPTQEQKQKLGRKIPTPTGRKPGRPPLHPQVISPVLPSEVAAVVERGDGKRRIKKSFRVMEEEERLLDLFEPLETPFSYTIPTPSNNTHSHTNGHGKPGRPASTKGEAATEQDKPLAKRGKPGRPPSAANEARTDDTSVSKRGKMGRAGDGPIRKQPRTQGPSPKAYSVINAHKGPQQALEEENTDDDAEDHEGEQRGSKGCVVCHVDNHPAMMLLCDGCEGEYHMFCLTPKVRCVPRSDWFCPECLTSGREPPLKRRRTDEQDSEEDDEEDEVLLPLRPDSFSRLPRPIHRHLQPVSKNRRRRMSLVRCGNEQGPCAFFAALFRSLNCPHPKFAHSPDLASTETLFGELAPKDRVRRAKEWRLWLSRRASWDWWNQQHDSTDTNGARPSYEVWQRLYKNFGLPPDRLMMQHAATFFNVNIILVRMPNSSTPASPGVLPLEAVENVDNAEDNKRTRTRAARKAAAVAADTAAAAEAAPQVYRFSPGPAITAKAFKRSDDVEASNVVLFEIDLEESLNGHQECSENVESQPTAPPKHNSHSRPTSPSSCSSLDTARTHPGAWLCVPGGISHEAGLAGPPHDWHSMHTHPAALTLHELPDTTTEDPQTSEHDRTPEKRTHYEAVLRYPRSRSQRGRKGASRWDNSTVVLEALQGMFSSDDPLIQQALSTL
eukprot:gb/GEZN01000823.1/.p1 GENE.gb/GEZN01000823.1/~~gb/GEZN01000823.1/.p1  ORF type:complete len:1116 (-),score=159.73 gb/GEZN01000823.1/:177-3524(-)